MREILDFRGNAYTKRIPGWIFNLSLNQIGYVLKEKIPVNVPEAADHQLGLILRWYTLPLLKNALFQFQNL